MGHSAEVNSLCPAVGHGEFTSALCPMPWVSSLVQPSLIDRFMGHSQVTSALCPMDETEVRNTNKNIGGQDTPCVLVFYFQINNHFHESPSTARVYLSYIPDQTVRPPRSCCLSVSLPDISTCALFA